MIKLKFTDPSDDLLSFLQNHGTVEIASDAAYIVLTKKELDDFMEEFVMSSVRCDFSTLKVGTR